MDGPDYSMKTFHIDGDNSSYFDKVNEKKIQEITKQINDQVRQEANQVIHNIVQEKDKEITKLNEQIEELKKETKHGSLSNLTDFDIINNSLTAALKYGEATKDNLNNERLEKIRNVIITWKEFFEEYKWKSNYISNKIKNLLKDTNDIL